MNSIYFSNLITFDSFEKATNTEKLIEDNIYKLLEIYIEPDQARSTLEVLSQLFKIEDVTDLQLLTGGRGTSKIFKFEVQGIPYVLRVTDTKRPNFFIDVSSEMNNLKTVEPLEISPKVHYCGSENGIIVMDYIENIRLTTQLIDHEEESEAIYGKLATTLRTLHKGPALAGEISSVFDDIRKITTTLDMNKVPPKTVEIINSLNKIEQVLQTHQTAAPCHKELNGNNVLYDGSKVFFIDWEGSGNCDPFVDLAISSVFFIFDPKKEEVFLNNYFLKEATQEQKAYLLLMKHVIHSFYFFKSLRRVVGLYKMDISEEKMTSYELPEYKKFILEYFNGCTKKCEANDFKTLTYGFLEQAIKNMESSDFKNAIETLGKPIGS